MAKSRDGAHGVRPIWGRKRKAGLAWLERDSCPKTSGGPSTASDAKSVTKAGLRSARNLPIIQHLQFDLSGAAGRLVTLGFIAGQSRRHAAEGAASTNDARNFHTARRFKREFGGLLYALRAKWPEARVAWSPVVDMTLVPALPKALGRLLEIRAALINRMGEQLCRERGAVPATRLPILDPKAGFSTDGFHASAAGYRAWAEHMAGFVLGE